jgi:hypothetical protein
MNTQTPIKTMHHSPDIEQTDPLPRQCSQDELIMDLERDQFVAETSRPVPRAPLSSRATVGLWALRAFAVLVGLMVIYTFVAELHP